jgi:hypothetical protein
LAEQIEVETQYVKRVSATCTADGALHQLQLLQPHGAHTHTPNAPLALPHPDGPTAPLPPAPTNPHLLQNLLNPQYHRAYWLGLQGNDSTLTTTSTYTWVDPYAPDLQLPASYEHWLGLPGPGRRSLLAGSTGANASVACATAQLQQVFGMAAGWLPANCSELHVFVIKTRRRCRREAARPRPSGSGKLLCSRVGVV